MNYAHGLNNDFVLTHEVNRQYSLMFEGSNFHNYGASLVISVKSRREVELLLLILGAEVNVIMDEQARKLYPDVWEWLIGRTYSEVLADLKWSCREEDEVHDLIQKIPLPRTLSNSFIKLHQDEPTPEPISQIYVHKVNKGNVLISKPYQSGNMFYFNGYQETLEFNIDHNSNRLEELIIFEAARQASIASTHLAGLPIEGILVVLKTRIEYVNFVELDNPYLIRTIPVYKSRGGVCYCVYHLLQNGKSCATGYFTALAHKTKHTYNMSRNKQRIS
ncbi:MAG TPA: AfsA-related hotdog domain-containing protein [Bacillota bacterium]|nr:AfsA-related hotdog domain-containing protein [Bacillota bacterium]